MNRHYYEVIKPGIVYGNALTAIAGFIFVTGWSISWPLFLGAVVGLSLIVASAGVVNNVFDRDIDALMERTKNRALVIGAIKPREALIYAALLGFAGVVLLFFYTNTLTLGIAVFGWVVYVLMYTPLKRLTPHSLFVGAVAGAVPPVVGYVAIMNRLDMAALAIFAFLFVWQIAHFLAIAIYRYHEYTNAGIPLFINKPPSERARHRARVSFYISLVVLLGWCAALILQR